MTNVGAIWGKYGRTFAGDDDSIRPAANAAFAFTGGSVVAWINQTFSTELNRWVTDFRDVGNTTGYFYITSNTNTLTASQGTHYVDLVATSTVPAGSWTMVAVLGINMGNDGQAAIGDRGEHQVGNNMLGTIGEVWIYNSTISIGDLTRIYQATKWRYQS